MPKFIFADTEIELPEDEEYVTDYGGFIRRLAGEHFCGVPGFETPGPGEGKCQQEIADYDPLIVYDTWDGVPSFVTYKFVQSYAGAESPVIQHFFEKYWAPKCREIHGDEWVFEATKRFIAFVGNNGNYNKLIAEILSREDEEERLASTGRLVSLEHPLQRDDLCIVYTYNNPDDNWWTQDFEMIGTRRDDSWCAVIFHTGVDARCGFVGPVFVKASIYNELMHGTDGEFLEVSYDFGSNAAISALIGYIRRHFEYPERVLEEAGLRYESDTRMLYKNVQREPNREFYELVESVCNRIDEDPIGERGLWCRNSYWRLKNREELADMATEDPDGLAAGISSATYLELLEEAGQQRLPL